MGDSKGTITIETDASAIIMRYVGEPLATMGMKPTDDNPKGCGMLFVGDGVRSDGTYFVWTNGSGALVYCADFQVLKSGPFSMEFPEFVSLRRDVVSRSGRGEVSAFAQTAKQRATAFLKRGMRCAYVEVQYLSSYLDDRARASETTVRDLARYLLTLGQKISWSSAIARPFDAIGDNACIGPAAELVFAGSTDLLMGEIMGMRGSSVVDRDDGEAVSFVVRHIHQNLNKPLRQEDMLALAGMSATKFKKLFKQSTGMHMSDYVSKHRIEHAKALLSCGTPIAGVAMETGFKSPAYFATFFRRATGQSPSEWRRSAQVEALPPTDRTVRLVYPEV